MARELQLVWENIEERFHLPQTCSLRQVLEQLIIVDELPQRTRLAHQICRILKFDDPHSGLSIKGWEGYVPC